MTPEDRLKEVEKSPLKFKVGDAVLMPGEVVEVDVSDTVLTYKVRVGEGQDFDDQWFTEGYLTKFLHPSKAL